MAYNSIGRSKENGTLKEGLLAWVFRVLLTSGNVFYGKKMESTGIPSPLRGYGLRKFLTSTSHLYHHEAIPSPALLMPVNDNIQLLKLQALISLFSLPISKESVIPVFPGTLKVYLRYVHLFPAPSPLPTVQFVISQLISTCHDLLDFKRASTYLPLPLHLTTLPCLACFRHTDPLPHSFNMPNPHQGHCTGNSFCVEHYSTDSAYVHFLFFRCHLKCYTPQRDLRNLFFETYFHL